MQTLDNDTAAFAGQLRSLLASELGDDALELKAINRRGEGYSWETYIVATDSSTASGTGVTSRFAVKREPHAGLLGSYDVQREVDLLRVAGEIGCPVPRVVGFRTRSEGARGFYAMEMIDGVVPMPWDVRKTIPDNAMRRALGLELAAIMARLHRKDARALSIGTMAPPPDGTTAGSDEAGKWHAVYLECAADRMPVLDLVFAWLNHRADAVSGRVSLVHNDLRVGNVVVKDGHVAAVLDWETADFTDPSADLAKFNLPTFRGRSSLASGFVEWGEFLDAYEAGTDWRPSQASLDYWTVLEIVKATVGGLRGMHYFGTGKTGDIRYANMQWQTHHSIKWLVELFESGTWGH